MATFTIAFEGTVLRLDPGSMLRFGRSADSDIGLPATDHLISRRSGEIRAWSDHLEIVNTSSSREFRLRPSIGEDVAVRPGASTTNRGMPVFDIRLIGFQAAQYSITCRGPAAVVGGAASAGAETQVRPFELSSAEQRMVEALCRSMVTRNGDDAAPETYAAVALQLGTTEGYVRNVLKGVRDRLTEYGVPGLGQGGGRARATDFRRPLCELAAVNGWAYGE